MKLEQLSDDGLIKASKSIRQMHQDRLDKLNDPVSIARLKARKVSLTSNAANPKFLELIDAIDKELEKRKIKVL